ncbi:hypothetical protein [Algihabitans albus]|uniref:hypothetical protein n=1 Tax=Algihabitans albus TaxID=2164067 RepID=UPI000E5C9111|nr:hypothetical protein [Algihabitans albus]
MTRPRAGRASYPATLEETLRAEPPEQRLWREVIDCAFRDAVELPKLWFGSRSRDHLERHRTRLQDEARRWLLSGGRDFVVVCDLAGRCPAEVRDQARRLLGEPETLARYRAARDSLPNRRSKGAKSKDAGAAEQGLAKPEAGRRP